MKFADDIIVAGLIFDGDENVHRNEVATQEIIVDYRNNHSTAIVNSTPTTALRVEVQDI